VPLSERDETVAWLRLTLVPGVSPANQQALLRALGTPEQVLASPRSKVCLLTDDEVAARLAQGPDEELLARTLRWLEHPAHHLITLGDAAYPQSLLQIGGAPSALYAIGRIELLNRPAFAIVGSRNATPQGVRDAEAFAGAIARSGLTIVSGLALGVDAAAHRGGLAEPASTIAVMGTGPDRLYPPGNRALGRDIAERGCLASEFPLGIGPIAGNFPQRNRLISGLARGVLVIEAAEQSGSLITARLAGEQGREVFALPGSIHSPLSKGCHRLIKEGAKLVESAEDILAELGVEPRATAPATADDAVDEDAPRPRSPLLRAMGHGPVTVDEIARATGQSAAQISAQLSQLEVDGRIEPLAGGRFQRVARR
jgi:DNA processing protein